MRTHSKNINKKTRIRGGRYVVSSFIRAMQGGWVAFREPVLDVSGTGSLSSGGQRSLVSEGPISKPASHAKGQTTNLHDRRTQATGRKHRTDDKAEDKMRRRNG
jgi:hypothetical protein